MTDALGYELIPGDFVMISLASRSISMGVFTGVTSSGSAWVLYPHPTQRRQASTNTYRRLMGFKTTSVGAKELVKVIPRYSWQIHISKPYWVYRTDAQIFRAQAEIEYPQLMQKRSVEARQAYEKSMTKI